MTIEGRVLRRNFPCGLGGQARAGPTSEGIGLEVAYMADGLRGPDRPHARQGHHPPLPVALFPVERCVPTALVDGGPTEREPEFRALVAAVLHERQILLVGNESGGEGKGMKENSVAGRFVIETKAWAAMADGVKVFVERTPGM